MFTGEREIIKKIETYHEAETTSDVSCMNNASHRSIHWFPKDEAVCEKWTSFVRTHRKDFIPSCDQIGQLRAPSNIKTAQGKLSSLCIRRNCSKSRLILVIVLLRRKIVPHSSRRISRSWGGEFFTCAWNIFLFIVFPCNSLSLFLLYELSLTKSISDRIWIADMHVKSLSFNPEPNSRQNYGSRQSYI